MPEGALRLLAFTVALILSGPLGDGLAQTPPTSTAPKPVVTPVEDFTAWTVEALIRERDTLGQQVADLNNRVTQWSFSQQAKLTHYSSH